MAYGLLGHCSWYLRLSWAENGDFTVGATHFWLRDVFVVHSMLLAVHPLSFPAYEGETWWLHWSKLSSAFGWEGDQMLKRAANLLPAVVFGDLYRTFFRTFFSFVTHTKYFIMQSSDSAFREILTDFRPHLGVKTPEISYYALTLSLDRPRALHTSRWPRHLRKCSLWGGLTLFSPLWDCMLQVKAYMLKRNGWVILLSVLFHFCCPMCHGNFGTE